MPVHAYAALEAGAELAPYEYDPGELGPLGVDVDVTHCGVCHSDVGMIDNEFGYSSFPVVAGHEAVGVVSAVGSAVDPEHLQVGQRVAIGAIAGTCMGCEFCLTGRQQLCAKRDDTIMRGDRGGFASSLRASDWRFAYPVPDAIESPHAGPMLCAGVTVFAPFLRHGVKPTDRVGIVGIGGLGHLAIQFASAWGCDVTAISSSTSKRDEAHSFGADHFIATRDSDELTHAAGTFDFILSTVSADIPWDDYLAALKPQGTLSVVGVPDNALTVGPFELLFSEKKISGGVPASRQETIQMLDFAARTGVRPKVELFDMSDINQAIARVRAGQARYRAVLTV
ncbi:NAD(P)-dependent alcohol dehydrogenase [Mycolicibacterium sp. 018/SC-01/001]|uniref:NAD(P)-dependent alcohol dehydrogenase n=1 Tax=Mycolicibacterium sp. 018/SC-01/001 TaxID=2592069 RepID=UPI00117FDAFF|nr:NAD(P)-dependent alcohol dehydrogenase [Mycolicibacterium sp. 018/SC-01/001]TRW87954.1 NAD(P)-dependent alcohol dehydrogenase [Mycolicibacterium sp. 018/SC-01/001]